MFRHKPYIMGDTYRYVYSKMTPKSYWILGVIIFAISIVALLLNTAVGVIVVLFGSYQILSREGIEVDIVNKKYRKFSSFGPVFLGEWISFSEVHYISVFNVTLVSNPMAIPEDYESRTNITQVNLITGHSTRLKLIETTDETDAWEFAKELATKLNLKIWDATGKKGKWYEEETIVQELGS